MADPLETETAPRAATADRAAMRLVTAVQALSLARNMEAIIDIVRKAARDVCQSDGASFILRDGERCHYVEEDAISPLWKGQKFPLSTCVSGWAMLNRKPAVIEDIHQDDRVPQDAYRPTFVKSLVIVPIRTEQPIGAIGIIGRSITPPAKPKSSSCRRWPTRRLSRWKTCGSTRNWRSASTTVRVRSPRPTASSRVFLIPSRMISSRRCGTSTAMRRCFSPITPLRWTRGGALICRASRPPPPAWASWSRISCASPDTAKSS